MFQLLQSRSRASTLLSFLSKSQSGCCVIALVELYSVKYFLNIRKLDLHKLNCGPLFLALIHTASDSSTKFIV